MKGGIPTVLALALLAAPVTGASVASSSETCSRLSAVNPPAHWRSLAWGNGVFTVIDCGGKIQTSIDGETWVVRDGGIPFALHCVAFGHGRFVAVGNEGAL